MILAAAPAPPKSGVVWRAELQIRGERMVDRVAQAVAPFGPLIVVGGPQVEGARFVDGGLRFVDSLRNGLSCATGDAVLVVTGDVPFLTTRSVQDFLDRCDLDADFCYPVVRAEACLRQFPGIRRTTLRTRDGEFTGGNIALVRRGFIERSMARVEAAYEARKSPVRLASMLGWGLLARILLAKIAPGTVTLEGLEQSVGRFLQARVRAVPTDFAGIGSDVDSFPQYLLLKDLQISPDPTENTV